MNNWVFNGNKYDLVSYAKNHPGGEYLINETKGYDITYLIQTNHNWTREKAIKILEKYKIGAVTNNEIINWDNEQYELQNELDFNIKDKKTPFLGWMYFLFMGSVYFYSIYLWSYVPSYHNSILLGTMGWMFCGFMQHEASHNSLSKYPKMNYYGRFILIPFADPFFWFKRHSILHHQYTNTELDKDYKTKSMFPVRHHSDVEWNMMNLLQIVSIYIYAPLFSFAYSIGYVTILQSCIVLMHYNIHNSLVLSILPFSIFGIWFMFITQLNHIQELASTDKLLKKPPNFMRHQIHSCVDYSHGNFAISCASIFLNYQTYHHLFPRISHFHFPYLKPKLDAILEKRGILINIKSLTCVICDYFDYLVKLSMPS
jgi:fatty acid desaturase